MSVDKIVKCPKCAKTSAWSAAPRGPFCSERCRLVDLGSWLSEDYAIEGTPEGEAGEPPAGPAAVVPIRRSDEERD
ncbi:MAG: DNA gyrase inhibitor YacG [Deltaproteobacteria bacterium]